MKIIETLTPTEKFWIINEDWTVGIFIDLFTDEDVLYDYNLELCKGYYFAYSGNKSVSIYYKNILETVEDNSTESANSIITGMLRSKFMHKWESIYKALREEYSVLNEYEHTETKSELITQDNDISNEYHRDANTDNDSMEKYSYHNDQSVIDDVSQTDVYAFNSSTAVPREKETNSSEITNERNPDRNYTDFEGNTKNTIDDETSIKEMKSNEIEGTYKKHGRHTAPSKLIDDEVKLRIKYIIADIIYKDIDSIMALQIY